VGASRTPGKLGAVMARSLRGFATGSRTLALVNGRDEEMYASLAAAAADSPVDLAVICVPAAAAHAALAELGGPVAVKLLDASVLHKIEIGGVRLGIRTPSELDAALDMLEKAGARRFLVETMAPDGSTPSPSAG